MQGKIWSETVCVKEGWPHPCCHNCENEAAELLGKKEEEELSAD